MRSFFGTIAALSILTGFATLNRRVEQPAAEKKVYQFVTPLEQDKPNSCWITVYTMLQRWKQQNQALTVNEVLGKMKDIYRVLYDTDAGLTKAAKDEFIRDNRLTAVAPQNFTVLGWADMVEHHGPLAVTIPAEDPAWLHVLVLVGVDPESEEFTWIDPGDGEEYSRPFSEFLEKYEAVGATQRSKIQVYHL